MATSGLGADPSLGDVNSMPLANLRTLDDRLLEAALARACGNGPDTDDRYWHINRDRNEGRTRGLGDARPL